MVKVFLAKCCGCGHDIGIVFEHWNGGGGRWRTEVCRWCRHGYIGYRDTVEVDIEGVLVVWGEE
jgi:hypothetical protein